MSTVAEIRQMIAAGTPYAEIMLSPHFSLKEATFSATAARLGIDNTPATDDLLTNIVRTCFSLEVVRSDILDHQAVTVHSLYRNQRVNTLVGGVPTSYHMIGLAADIVCPAIGAPIEVARRIAKSPIVFDQLIIEYGQWVHFGLPKPGETARRDLLTYCFKDGRRAVLKGLVDA